MTAHDTGAPLRVRADVWLWAARLYRTRSLAKRAIEAGHVELDGQPLKPSKLVAAGDRLRITRAEERLELEVLGTSELRGPAPVAQQLYAETEASRLQRERRREERRLSGRPGPAGRPDRESRRLLRGLKQGR